MANDKIMVTVRVPEGLRAVVVMTDYGKGEAHSQEQTVVGGTSQEFFADGVRRVTVREGMPHSITDALDRKPGEA